MNRDPNFDFYSLRPEQETPAEQSEPTVDAGQGASDTAKAPAAPLFALPRPDREAVRATRHAFSRVGWAFFAMMFVWYASALVLENAFAAQDLPSWFSVLSSTLPLYVFGMPALLLFMIGLPRRAPQRQAFGKGAWLVALTVAFLGMLGGTLIGNAIMSNLSLITGYSFENAVEAFFDIPLWVSTLLSVVLAPVFEELIFRKLMIDRLLPFGEWTAILVPAILFGAMHGNLYQLFYAITIGLVCGYVYVRSGKWSLCVAIHAIVNLVCGVFPTYIQSQIDLEAFSELAATASDPTVLLSFVSQHLVGFGLLLLYDLILYGAAITGLVLLIVHRRKIRLEPTEMELPRGFRVTPALLNGGIVASLCVSGLLVLLSLIVSAVPM